MGTKLFAMEELDAELGEEVVMDTTPEEGEVANVQVDVEQEVAEVSEGTDSIEEGMEAADQLEQVEEVVTAAAEAEGLEPVAAEAIKLAVEAISARIGANPKSVYSLYATENFQSASSRKANTKIALEGIGEFLKDLWKKIKGALSRLWEKVKAFWDKHISSLGQVKKALDSMKAKVAKSSGQIENGFVEKAPGGLVAAFAVTSGDITSDGVGKYIAAHKAAKAGTAAVKASGKAAANAGLDAVKADAKVQLDKVTGKSEIGTKGAPLVGGVYTTYTVKADGEELLVEVDRETIDKTEEAGLNVADKTKLATLIKDTLDIITDDIKSKSEFEKDQNEFKKTMGDIESALNKTVTDGKSSEAAKEVRKTLKLVYKANAKVPQMEAERVSMDVKLAKAVLGYAAVCLKNYK